MGWLIKFLKGSSHKVSEGQYHWNETHADVNEPSCSGNGNENRNMYQSIPFPWFRICAGCDTEIGSGSYLNGMGAFWHPECFRCHSCNVPIYDYEFSMSGNYPHHKFCYKEQYYPKCDVCRHFIPINAGGLIEYKKHPFWGQKYCPIHELDGTPRCCSCELLEPRETIYVALDDVRKLCLECLDSAVMDTTECQPLYLEIQEFYKGLNMKVDQQVPFLLVERQALNKTMDGVKSITRMPQVFWKHNKKRKIRKMQTGLAQKSTSWACGCKKKQTRAHHTGLPLNEVSSRYRGKNRRKRATNSKFSKLTQSCHSSQKKYWRKRHSGFSRYQMGRPSRYYRNHGGRPIRRTTVDLLSSKYAPKHTRFLQPFSGCSNHSRLRRLARRRKLLTGLVLAYEMMRAWLRLQGYQVLREDVEEGICQVLAHLWLESQILSISGSNIASTSSSVPVTRSSKQGMISSFERKLLDFFKNQIESDISPIIGNGFRAGNQAVLKYGLRKTLDHIRMTGTFPL